MPERHIIYLITAPEDKILHHILWNQQQHPRALFAIVAMNPVVDQWLQKQKVECSLVHGDSPYSPNRLEEFLSVMQHPIFQNITIPGSQFSFAENVPVDRLLQFFEFESRQQEQQILKDVSFDEMICSFDPHHPIIHCLTRKCVKQGIPVTAIQCSEIRTREMLDVALFFTNYIVDLDDDRDFLVRELGVNQDRIEVVGKSLYDAFGDMKYEVEKASVRIASQLQLSDHTHGIFLVYYRRHNWEIRRFLKIMKQAQESNANQPVLFVYCENDADTEEFQVLFDEELKQIKWQLAPNHADITILNHCFPVWLAFHWNRDLEIAGRLGQKVLLYDPFDLNRTSRIGIDHLAWKVLRDDETLLNLLQNLPISHSEPCPGLRPGGNEESGGTPA